MMSYQVGPNFHTSPRPFLPHVDPFKPPVQTYQYPNDHADPFTPTTISDEMNINNILIFCIINFILC